MSILADLSEGWVLLGILADLLHVLTSESWIILIYLRLVIIH